MSEMPPQPVVERLRRYEQQHVLRWWDELGPDERRSLLQQIDEVDFDLIQRLLDEHRTGSTPADENPCARAKRAAPPAEIIRLPKSADEEAGWSAAAERGRELLAAGRVGVVLVAGGQGTRLGFPHPKGMYPIGPAGGATLFQMLSEQVLARSRQAGVGIPLYVMTSDATHEETVAFFAEHRHFGLDSGNVFFFQQGNMPAVDAETGRLLLAEKGRLSTGPDGHGGLLAALDQAGLFDEMRGRGIDMLFYMQVDNPTVKVCDPAFLGFHVLRGSEMSTKVVAKRSPEERMGVVVSVDGSTQIIEYSDLPPDIARQTEADGQLRLWAGNTAVHICNRNFLERLRGSSRLPYHVAHKAVPYLDEAGREVVPDEPNAYKFERFIFDALPSAKMALVVEADRAREFNPVKNAEGDDSPATARAAMTAIFRDWLRSAGAEVSDAVPVEISPLFALDAEDVRRKIKPGVADGSGPIYLR